MRPLKHLAVSAITGATAYGLTGSLSAGTACFLTGWLIDVDHLYEYVRDNGWSLSIKRFRGYFYGPHHSTPGKKLCFFLHAHELALILTLICFLSKLNLTLSFATVGYILHLLCDQFSNRVSPLGYFLTYRMAKGFDKWFVLDARQT